jgi:FkbM family methyltransferase
VVLKWSSDVDYILPWLSADSVVVEVGAYRGDWVYEVATRYHCTIHAFEPATLALKFLRAKVQGLENVTIYPIALGKHNEEITLYDCQRDGAGIYARGGRNEPASSRDVSQVIDEIGPVDLMHLNAEGSEMDIIERLVETGQIASIDHLMIQWHPRDTSSALRVGRVGKSLDASHYRKVGPRAWEMFKRLPS